MPFAVVYTPEPTRPGAGPCPGTVRLLNYLCNDSPWAATLHSLGIYNPRDICGNPWPDWRCKGSQHASGRAGDAGCPTVRPNGHPKAREAAMWLVENHAALGIQEVIFAGRRWSNTTRSWRAYKGRSDHFDHVHFAQHAVGASRLSDAQIRAVAPKPKPSPQPNPTTPPRENEPMYKIVKGNSSSTVYITDGIYKRAIVGGTGEINALLLAGLAEQNGSNPFTLAQSVVDSIETV